MYDKQTYTVCNRDGYALSEALSLWKAKYPEFIDFEKDVIKHPGLHDFRDFVKEMWDNIIPVTVKQALNLSNTEDRRVYFDCIGVRKLFQQLNPQLLDKQVVKKKRTKWNDENKDVVYEFEDVYELYQIDGKKLFQVDKWGREPNPVYAVRCWCTTTNREYWIYVPREAATGQRWWGDDKIEYDAIRAIAWTLRIDVDKPEKIYRQGDIVVAKMGEKSTIVNPYHLDKDAYLSLMYSET